MKYVLNCLVPMVLAASAHTQNSPAFDFQNLMDTYFDDTAGLIAFDTYTVAFAPEESFAGYVAVLDEAGQVVGKRSFYPDYVNREGVFARVRAEGPADVTLTTPGAYTVVLAVGDQPATRFPVRLEQSSAGDDPFNPEKTFRFDGPWRTLAHLTTNDTSDGPAPELTFWVGGMDMAEGASRDGFLVTLLRADEAIAHSKRDLGVIEAGHFKRKHASLYHPHDEKGSANAKLFLLSDWQVEGAYELRVTRKSDGQTIRSYDFDVLDGKIQGLERSQLGHEPATDYVMPRVLKRGATGLEMSETIWIEDRR